MKVADFFCGAGGFSEGFRQMGFDVVFGLDNWRPAIDTINLNHRGINAIKMNILDLSSPEKIDEIVPDTEVIIGSPPCVAFSGSNKAGKADKSPGIILIEQFLKIVAWKLNKPDSILKYWILENVPNSSHYVKDEYTFKELGLKGGKKTALKIHQRNILNAADYGAPQGRLRFFCGDYPTPEKTNDKGDWNHTAKVLNSLTDPLRKDNSREITDPCYGFHIKKSELTDHFYDTTVSDWEWKRAKRLKEDHGFMGVMSFPEKLERAGRTIMATRSASTREAILFGGIKDDKGNWKSYRMPTIREIASIMSFPITYQFEANNEASKYRLVGNAVCTMHARALAKAILEEEGIHPPKKFKHIEGNPKPKLDLTGQKREIKEKNRKSCSAKFARHIPYMKIRGFRAEMNNIHSDFVNQKFVWKSILHKGSGKHALKCECDNKQIEKLLSLDIGFDYRRFEVFKKDIEKITENELVDSGLFQMIYCNWVDIDKPGPHELLHEIRSLIDKHFPDEKYSDYWVKNDSKTIRIKNEKIPLRILAGQYALNDIVSKINNM